MKLVSRIYHYVNKFESFDQLLIHLYESYIKFLQVNDKSRNTFGVISCSLKLVYLKISYLSIRFIYYLLIFYFVCVSMVPLQLYLIRYNMPYKLKSLSISGVGKPILLQSVSVLQFLLVLIVFLKVEQYSLQNFYLML